MTTNFDKIMKDMEQTTEQTSDFFKFPVGSTKVRILTDFVQTYSLYEGAYPNSKYVRMLSHYQKPKEGQSVKSSAWAWAIIRGTPDELKIVQFPYSLIKQLGDMKKDPDWEFESFPMPYDITVENSGEGGARYSLRGSPKKTTIPASVMEDLAGKKQCEEIIKAIMDKQSGGKTEPSASKAKPATGGPAFKGTDYPQDINPEDIPF